MDCRKIEKILDQFIREELDVDLQKKIHKHIETCENCREQFAELQSLNSLLSFEDEIKPPMNFTSDIMKQVNNLTKKSNDNDLRYGLWGKSMIAAAIIILMLNFSGINRENHFEKFLEKTLCIQRSIIFSVDETNKSILQMFNNISFRRD